MMFSRIEIVDRLRKTGLWQEASLFKDGYKRRLMSKGISRKEAGELAWEETARVFEVELAECPTAPQITTFGDFPPAIKESIANQAGEPDFNLIWKLWCLCLAREECQKNNAIEADTAVADRIAQAGTDYGDQEMATVARDKTNRFVLQFAIPKLLAVITRLEASEDEEEYAEELQCHVNEMTRFGVVT